MPSKRQRANERKSLQHTPAHSMEAAFKETMNAMYFFKGEGYAQPPGCGKCFGTNPTCRECVVWRKDTKQGYTKENIVLICCFVAAKLNAGESVNGHKYNSESGITEGP